MCYNPCMTCTQLQEKINQAYLDAVHRLDLDDVRQVLTSSFVQPELNRPGDMLDWLCEHDNTAVMTRYLMTSPEVKKPLRFHEGALLFALHENNVEVTRFFLQTFNTGNTLEVFLCGEFGISEVDRFSPEMIALIYFEHAQPFSQQVLLQNLIAHGNTEGMSIILRGDPELNHKEVLGMIAKHGNHELFTSFDRITGFSSQPKNIPFMVHMSAHPNLSVETLEWSITNDAFTGHYKATARVFKKLQHRSDLLAVLIAQHHCELTPGIERVISSQTRQMFHARDLSEKLTHQFNAPSTLSTAHRNKL